MTKPNLDQVRLGWSTLFELASVLYEANCDKRSNYSGLIKAYHYFHSKRSDELHVCKAIVLNLYILDIYSVLSWKPYSLNTSLLIFCCYFHGQYSDEIPLVNLFQTSTVSIFTQSCDGSYILQFVAIFPITSLCYFVAISMDNIQMRFLL